MARFPFSRVFTQAGNRTYGHLRVWAWQRRTVTDMASATSQHTSPWRAGRWWATTVIAAAAIVVCVLLGAWQFDRAQTRNVADEPRDPMARAVVPLANAVPEGGRVFPGTQPRAVVVSGRYVPADQVEVPGRQQQGVDATYVVTPLLTTGGPAVLVLRGWVPAGTFVPPPTDEMVTVTGWLVPSEPLDAGTIEQLELSSGQLATVTSARIASAVRYPLVDGYVGLVEQSPPQDQPAAAQVTPVEVPLLAAPVRWSLVSLGYAMQWWVFALIGLVMWVQALRLERRREASTQSEASPPVG